MTEHDGVDTGHLCQVIDHILVHALAIICVHTAVRKCDDDIGTGSPHFWDIVFGRSDDILCLDQPAQFVMVPIHDLRRDKTDVTDIELVRVAIAVNNGPGADDIGLKIGLVIGLIVVTIIDKNVRRNIRKISTVKGFHKKIQAIVEVVIANISHIVSKQVHGLVSGVDLTETQHPATGYIIAHGITLQQVTVVHQHRIG